jgi:hypothetical protein
MASMTGAWIIDRVDKGRSMRDAARRVKNREPFAESPWLKWVRMDEIEFVSLKDFLAIVCDEEPVDAKRVKALNDLTQEVEAAGLYARAR